MATTLNLIPIVKGIMLWPIIIILGCSGTVTARGSSSPPAQVRANGAPYQNGKFRNPHLPAKGRWGDFWRWRLGLGPKEENVVAAALVSPYQPQILRPDQNSLNHADPQTIQITWLGHATFLIQVAGLNILTDPMFSERASPLSFVGPKRLIPLPLHQEELPPIQAAVISHNHYDHLDEASVKKLGPTVTFFVPRGLARWFQQRGLPLAQELDWWQTTEFGPIRLHCVPTQHFSMRSPFDANKTLWGGWVLETPAGNIFFAGDTGYSPDFQEIGQRHGPFRLALIPIGGYMPRWFMKPMHVNPEEAVQIHRDVRAQQSIGMHWGTFKLTEEPVAEPPLFLQQVLRAQQLPEEQFLVLRPGETKVFSADQRGKAALGQDSFTATSSRPGG